MFALTKIYCRASDKSRFTCETSKDSASRENLLHNNDKTKAQQKSFHGFVVLYRSGIGLLYRQLFLKKSRVAHFGKL